jgi:preprotein translocase subunit SecE
MIINSIDLKSIFRKIKFELLQIKYPSIKETIVSSFFVFLMLIIVSGLVIFFDFSVTKIIKLLFVK